jgi:hypothetical protein
VHTHSVREDYVLLVAHVEMSLCHVQGRTSGTSAHPIRVWPLENERSIARLLTERRGVGKVSARMGR